MSSVVQPECIRTRDHEGDMGERNCVLLQAGVQCQQSDRFAGFATHPEDSRLLAKLPR
jgi:hypothetical protein